MEFYTTIVSPLRKKLRVRVAGAPEATTTVVFVHGFGTDMNEGEYLFRDIAGALGDQYRTVQFDFAGCGESEGAFDRTDLRTMRVDLGAVLGWVEEQHPGDIRVIAHSFGTYVVADLGLERLRQVIFTAILRLDPVTQMQAMQARIVAVGGTVDELGQTRYPRSRGDVTLIGPMYWATLRAFDVRLAMARLGKMTKLFIIRPGEDQLVPEANLLSQYMEIVQGDGVVIPGDHSYSDPKHRQVLIAIVKKQLASLG